MTHVIQKYVKLRATMTYKPDSPSEETQNQEFYGNHRDRNGFCSDDGIDSLNFLAKCLGSGDVWDGFEAESQTLLPGG